MPVQDAYAKLEAQLPKNKIQVRSDTLPTLDKPVIRSFSSRPAQDVGGGVESDQVQVDATYPPSKQVVWRVIREHFFANRGIPKATLLASLREKYGKETITNPNLRERAANDSQIQSLVWLFDDQGRLAPLPKTNSAATVTECLNTAVELAMNLSKNAINNPQRGWCFDSYNAVYASVRESELPELYLTMRVEAVSLPLALRASEATAKWQKDIAEGQHKQDVEKAKQQEKPKL